MNKKIIIFLLLIIIIVISIVVFNKYKEAQSLENNIPIPEPVPLVISTEKEKEPEKTVEVPEENIQKIKEESYLEILLQIQSFDSYNTNYEPLLEAAMRIARAQNLMEAQEDGMFLEYVPKTTIHDIIFELSGTRITEPIEIDDYYYLYDEAGEYYYVVPVGVNWMQLKNIDSMLYEKTNDLYIINCSGKLGSQEDGVVTDFDDIEVKIKYKPNNKYIKYQLVSIATAMPDINIDG